MPRASSASSLSSFASGGIVARETRRALQLLDQRMQRAGRVVRRALVEQAYVGLALEPRAHFAHQTRLADPRLARQQDDMPLAVFGLLPPAQQQRDLLVAADQRRQARRLSRLEAPFGATLAFDPPGGKRLGEAFETLRAEILEIEHAAEQPPRRLADDHAARRRKRLQSRREIRRLPDHGFFCARAPSPISSPTMTRPVAMPTLAASGSPAAVSSRASAATSASPALTARSASSSCARGQPKYASTPSPMYLATWPPQRSTTPAQRS